MFFLPLLIALAGGALLAARFDPRARTVDRLALGVALAGAVWAGLGFVVASIAGRLTDAIVWSSAVATLVTGILVHRTASGDAGGTASEPPSPRNGRLATATLRIAAVLVIALAYRLADRTLIETERGLAIGDNHNLGDLPFHMAIAAGFAWGENFPPNHPELAGVPLTYPFLGDFLSAMLLRLGAPWRDAFFWPTWLFALAVVPALVRAGEVATGSRALGRLAAALTLFSGGLGFVDLLREGALSAWSSGGLELTIRESGLRYANFIVTLFIPQRSILVGWPLLFFGLAFLGRALRARGKSDHETGSEDATRAGLLFGLLPLVHSHSFAVATFALLLAAASPARALAVRAGASAAPLALPALVFMAGRNSLETSKFFAWNPGFDHGSENEIVFWIRNGGVFLALAIAGLRILRARRSQELWFVAPFAALFAGANLFQLSPWIWDNMKFLAPAHAGLAWGAAIAVRAAWNRGVAGRSSAVLLVGAAIASGALDVARLTTGRVQHDLFSKDDLLFAERVREALPPRTVVLAAPAHDQPVLLSGRPLYLGYEGHLWSQGLPDLRRGGVPPEFYRDPGALPDAVGAVALTNREERMYGARIQSFAAFRELVAAPHRLYAPARSR